MGDLEDRNPATSPNIPVGAVARPRVSLADSLRRRRAVTAAEKPSIAVREVVLEQMKKGRFDDHLANCVLSRLGTYRKQGLEPDWGPEQPKAMLRGGFHFLSWDADGKKLSKKQTETQIARYIIGHWERDIEQSGELVFSPIQVVETNSEDFDQSGLSSDCSSTDVSQEDGGEDVPFGTSKTLDDVRGWDVTLAQRIFRTSPDKLLDDLTPVHRKLAWKASRTFSLEETIADDLIQEARLRVFENLHSFEGRSQFTTWAWTVSWHAMIAYVRRVLRGRDKEILALDAAHGSSDFTDSTDLRLTLISALQAVPDSHLVLYQTFGYKDKEIADSNVRMRRLRARNRLCVLLHEDLALSA